MQKLIIHKLGPIDDCEIVISDMLVFTGEQASGKSTIAKSIFFFKNLRNLMEEQAIRMQLYSDENKKLSLKNRWIKAIRLNFLQTFGSTWCMDENMALEYFYTDNICIKISLVNDQTNPNYIWIELCEEISQFLEELGELYAQKTIFFELSRRIELRERINDFFQDGLEPVYIPAGRSMLTLLAGQLNYIYGVMDDIQKRELDYCTQSYLERIMQIKTFFSKDIESLIMQTKSLTDIKLDQKLLNEAVKYLKSILQGEYQLVDGEERLNLSNRRYVKINFASSGQQEAVWILNVLFYYLINSKKAYFIIEEPESHLFPNAQKLMTEFISLAKASHNQVLVTTHSPYVLGTLNNLLYAHETAGQIDKRKLNEIINERCWISPEGFQAFFVQDGVIANGMDDEIAQIRNEVIDGASISINADFDKMVELRYQEDKKRK
ncbi:MAG: ATP-binding protein [Roseburia sp.]|nr:ATP-binding protein [Roseburia sp.]